MNKVFISGLRFDCIIGILPQERVQAQEIVIDVEADCPGLEQAGREHNLDCSLDYAALTEVIRDYVTARRAGLLEELAAELADLIMEKFHTPRVWLRLAKTQAVPGTAAVGIEFCKKA